MKSIHLRNSMMYKAAELPKLAILDELDEGYTQRLKPLTVRRTVDFSAAKEWEIL